MFQVALSIDMKMCINIVTGVMNHAGSAMGQQISNVLNVNLRTVSIKENASVFAQHLLTCIILPSGNVETAHGDALFVNKHQFAASV